MHGAIGILFEQASSRGHLMNTRHGELTFPFTIENQFTTSLTTLAAADAMRDELGSHQRAFYRRALEEGTAYGVGGWAFGDRNDPGKAHEMARRLAMHNIIVGDAPPSLREDSEAMYFVPCAQPQFQLVRALFETRTSWDDNTFYDVSSWTFPLSFGVWHRAIPRKDLPTDFPEGWPAPLGPRPKGRPPRPQGSPRRRATCSRGIRSPPPAQPRI